MKTHMMFWNGHPVGWAVEDEGGQIVYFPEVSSNRVRLTATALRSLADKLDALAQAPTKEAP